jgi:hypothetical protein
VVPNRDQSFLPRNTWQCLETFLFFFFVLYIDLFALKKSIRRWENHQEHLIFEEAVHGINSFYELNAYYVPDTFFIRLHSSYYLCYTNKVTEREAISPNLHGSWLAHRLGEGSHNAVAQFFSGLWERISKSVPF